MSKRSAKWFCLMMFTGGTLFASCPAGAIALEFLDSSLQGAYQSTAAWGAEVMAGLLDQLAEAATSGE
jgi:hypothetical protein